MNWNAISAVFLALAVATGAFGAHGLRDKLDAYSMGVWEKAVFYHFVHSLGMLAVSILPRTQTFPPRRLLTFAGFWPPGYWYFQAACTCLPSPESAL